MLAHERLGHRTIPPAGQQRSPQREELEACQLPRRVTLPPVPLAANGFPEARARLALVLRRGAEEREARRVAATKIQAVARGDWVRDTEAREARAAAATAIQAAARGYLRRLRLDEEEEREAAATTIQAWARAIAVRHPDV